MATLWHCALLVSLYLEITHMKPTNDTGKYFVIMNQAKNDSFELQTGITNSQEGNSSSTETDEKLYIPFDPSVIEGDAPSVRKTIFFEPDSASLPTLNQNQSNQWKKQQQTSVFVSNSPEKSTKAFDRTFADVPNPTSNDEYEATPVEILIQPEEINYLDKKENENSQETPSPATESKPNNNTKFFQQKPEKDFKQYLSEQSDPSPENDTHQFQIISAPNVSQVEFFDTTFPSNSFSNNSRVLDDLNNSSVVYEETNPLLTTSIETSHFAKSLTTNSPKEADKPPVTTTEPTPKDNESLATAITKINIRFTVSSEDTRRRTKVESYETDSENTETIQSNEEVVTRNTISDITDAADNASDLRRSTYPSTARQAKAIAHSNHSLLNLYASSPTLKQRNMENNLSENLTKNISVIEELANNPSLHPDTTVVTTQKIATNAMEIVQNSTSMTTSDTVISVNAPTFPSFTDKNTADVETLLLSLFNKNLKNPATERNNPSVLVHEQTESTVPMLTADTTSPTVERATVRRRLLRPVMRGTRRTNTANINSRSQAPEIIQLTNEYTPLQTSTPLRTLNETIAPPVVHMDDDMLDYPMDMPDINDLFNRDTTEKATISPKTTNTIIISSVVGGCAIVFFAFLMVFCMCKQRTNRRTRY